MNKQTFKWRTPRYKHHSKNNEKLSNERSAVDILQMRQCEKFRSDYQFISDDSWSVQYVGIADVFDGLVDRYFT
jgi:hypothetical protein